MVGLLYILVLDETARTYAIKVGAVKRANGISVDMTMEKRSMKSQFKQLIA